MDVLQRIIANNLRFFRAEAGLTQEHVAQRAGLSLRLYHKIEAGDSNPTVESIGAVAKVYQVTPDRILRLSFHRTPLSPDRFLERFMATFSDAPIAVLARDLSGRILWENNGATGIHTGQADGSRNAARLNRNPKGPAREMLRNQLVSERRGIVMPYINYYEDSESEERIYLRFYPTLIMPLNGREPYFASVHLTLTDDDQERTYYRYCDQLLRIDGMND